jgi:hypothetical protein
MRVKLVHTAENATSIVHLVKHIVSSKRAKYAVLRVDRSENSGGFAMAMVSLLNERSVCSVTLVLINNANDSDHLVDYNGTNDVEHFLDELVLGTVSHLAGCLVVQTTSQPVCVKVFETEEVGLQLMIVYPSGWCYLWKRVRHGNDSMWAHHQCMQISESLLQHVHYNSLTGELTAIEGDTATGGSRLWVCSLAFPSEVVKELSKRHTLCNLQSAVLRMHCDHHGGMWVICSNGQVSYYDAITGRCYGGCRMPWRSTSTDFTPRGPEIEMRVTSCMATRSQDASEHDVPDRGSSASRLYAVHGNQLFLFEVAEFQLQQAATYDLEPVLRSRGNSNARSPGRSGRSQCAVHDLCVPSLSGQEPQTSGDVLALLTATTCLLVQLPTRTHNDMQLEVVTASISVPLPRTRTLVKPSATSDGCSGFTNPWYFVQNEQSLSDETLEDNFTLCAISDGVKELRVCLEAVPPREPFAAAEVRTAFAY